MGWSVYLVVAFVLPGRLLDSSDRHLDVWIKVIYAFSFVLGVLVSLRIPSRRRRKQPNTLDKKEDDENYQEDDVVALTNNNTMV